MHASLFFLLQLVASTVVPVLTLPPDLPPGLLEISVLPLDQWYKNLISSQLL